jgi:uncharacterized protein YutE (UPF0331/DUF86 family)
MTHMVERLTELRRHLDHLYEIRPRVSGADDLLRDLSLHNDVLYSLLACAQLVIDIAGELGSRSGLRFEDYTEAVRNLVAYPEFPPELVRELARLPGFRNVLLHDYIALDFEQVVRALHSLDPIEEFLRQAAKLAEA